MHVTEPEVRSVHPRRTVPQMTTPTRGLRLAGEGIPSKPPRLAFAAKGFRPLFALAALHAVLIIPLWLTIIMGATVPDAYLDPTSFHAHEMIFGFTSAVIAGFLLTAVGNWTQRETLTGLPLLALSALWVSGRIAMFYGSRLPRGVCAMIDLAFLPALVVALGRPLLAAKNRRNFVVLLVVVALFASNLLVHLAALRALPADWAHRACSIALDLTTFLILLIAGRIFPMFTRNATRVATIRSHPKLDLATIVGMGALVLVDAGSKQRLGSLLAGCIGVLAAARAVHWGGQHSYRDPLLWILHAGYAWLVLGLLLRPALLLAPALPPSLATHALTVGSIGSVTLGMMARVSLGHTGRALVAPRTMTWAFAAVTCAALFRVLLPLVVPSSYFACLVLAGISWTIAFGLFLLSYLPILASPR